MKDDHWNIMWVGVGGPEGQDNPEKLQAVSYIQCTCGELVKASEWVQHRNAQ